MTRLFVTGTDTDVGKTVVSCALLRAAARQGLQTIGLKPLASGCRREPDGTLLCDDAQALLEASTLPVPLEAFTQYYFEPAIAPGRVADELGIVIDFDYIHRVLLRISADFLIAEGAGGWYCPVGKKRTIADLAEHLGFPVVIVARTALGTINHTLLTIEAVRRRSLAVAGVILNDAKGDTPEHLIAANRDDIEQYGAVSVLGILAHGAFDLFADTKTLEQFV
jgi:dethiobiotin synthetase